MAQDKASEADEEEELARASEVVARLTAPISEKQKIRLREVLVRCFNLSLCLNDVKETHEWR